MALPDILMARLIETTFDNRLSGRFAMLGRQRFIGSRKGKAARYFDDVLKRYLPGISEDDLRNPDNIYTEKFFQTLGYATVDSIDIARFENASIIQDLGQSLKPDLHERFEVIYDGGTCEHIFELPTAYRNLHEMLSPGGVLIGHSPCNNWINHSFYQINPEIVYGFWEKAMGYEILHLRLQPLLPNFIDQVVTTTNPNQTNVRPRLSAKPPMNSPIILDFAVRKPLHNTGSGRAYQTDYVHKWASGEG